MLSACFVDNMNKTTSAAETTGVLTTTTHDPTTSTAATDATTGTLDCADFKATLLVEDATVVAPMKTLMTTAEGTVAYSEKEEEGTVEFRFTAPCAGTYAVWGRVLDQKPGPGTVDPDSFHARVDDGPEITWLYGCTTGATNTDWSWQPVRSLSDDDDCEVAAAWPLELTAGEHAITLRNLEDSFTDSHAAVARILVTSDPDYTPTSE